MGANEVFSPTAVASRCRSPSRDANVHDVKLLEPTLDRIVLPRPEPDPRNPSIYAPMADARAVPPRSS